MCEQLGAAESGVRMQRQMQENASDLQAFLTDMAEWERTARQQDTNSPAAKEFPAVRSKSKKGKNSKAKAAEQKRISSLDYSSWEKFNADKACEVVETKTTIPPSLDSKESEEDKKERLRQEAQLEKEKGNKFVQQKNWDEAIVCYTRAIELYQNDAIYYANRALCYLKKEKLHEAEADCTSALDLDPTYVKALQRRSCAREGLGSLRRAACDLGDILRIEPDNALVKKQLSSLIQRMGTKGPNSKSSPASTPSCETPPTQFIFNEDDSEKITDENISQDNYDRSSHKESKQNKRNKKKNNYQSVSEVYVEAIEKPPHLRSNKTLIRVPIAEIPKGSSITAVSLKATANDFTKIVSKHINKKNPFKYKEQMKKDNMANSNKGKGTEETETGENVSQQKSLKTNDKKSNLTDSKDSTANSLPPEDANAKIEDSNKQNYKAENIFTVPKSSVQFISDWRLLRGDDKQRSAYLKAIHPSNIPTIFKESLESDILSDILETLCNGGEFVEKDGSAGVLAYLKSIADVKRFSALTMFMTEHDKQLLTKILNCSKDNGECADEDIRQIKNKYEI